jgi:hypothetical protein
MSASPPSVHEAARRARDYWEQDGLPKLVSGVIFLTVALVFFLRRRTQDWVSLCLLSFLVYGSTSWIVDRLKYRFTYRRTGYVTPPDSISRNSMSTGLEVPSLLRPETQDQTLEGLRTPEGTPFLLFATGVVLWFGLLVETLATGTIWYAVAAAVLSGFFTHKERYVNRIAYTGFPFLIYAATVLPLRPPRLWFLIAGVGVLHVLEGGVRLVLYRRRNPQPTT